MVVQFLHGYKRADRRCICGRNRGEAAVTIRVWGGGGQSTRWGPHRFRAGGQNHGWPTSGQGGYITPAVWGVPTSYVYKV